MPRIESLGVLDWGGRIEKLAALFGQNPVGIPVDPTYIPLTLTLDRWMKNNWRGGDARWYIEELGHSQTSGYHRSLSWWSEEEKDDDDEDEMEDFFISKSGEEMDQEDYDREVRLAQKGRWCASYSHDVRIDTWSAINSGDEGIIPDKIIELFERFLTKPWVQEVSWYTSIVCDDEQDVDACDSMTRHIHLTIGAWDGYEVRDRSNFVQARAHDMRRWWREINAVPVR